MTTDEYRIDITPAQARRGGYHVQVYVLPTGQALLSESGRLPWHKTGPWRATREGAYHHGLCEAYETHDGCDLPMVVWHEGVKVIDETAPGDEPETARKHCPCCGHGTCIRTGHAYGPSCSCDGFCVGPAVAAWRAKYGTPRGAR